MGQTEIKNLFFENPTKSYHIREIARNLNMSKTAVGYHIHQLLKKQVIISVQNIFTQYKSNETSRQYRFSKLIHALKIIEESGVVEYLENELTPKCVILFGSFAKAEYHSGSDIDIFVQSSEQSINLKKFEKKLLHEINLFFEPDLNKLSPELLNNIINGIKLKGYLKLK